MIKKYSNTDIKRVIFLCVFGVMCGVTSLLVSEYLFFKRQSDRLLVLQDDYRMYIAAVNKILQDYNKTKERLDILKVDSFSAQSREKKKEVVFPEYAKVISSDQTNVEDTLFLVNRDFDYLKELSRNYIKKSDEKSLVKNFNPDLWCNYTDYALSRVKKKSLSVKAKAEKAKKGVQKKKRNKKIASYRGVSSVKNKSTEILFAWPISQKQFWISSFFGSRKKPNGTWGFHYGIDMAAIRGTNVYSVGAGIVIEARYSRSYGNTVVIAHNRKYKTRYAHLDKILVFVGQKVKQKKLIGKVGRTGLVWKPQGRDPSHLHFEVHAFVKKVNPLRFLA